MLCQEVEDYIKDYFWKGYSYRLIHYLLESRHNYTIGYHYLKRKVLPNLGLKRRGSMEVEFCDVTAATQREIINGCSGSEQLRRILATKHNVRVTRDFCRDLVRHFDAEGVERRKKRRLRRRIYINKGPNYVWHIDGYDKLSPYGICIHGCIDGFSRKVVWLNADISNKQPGIVAKYYVDAIEREGGMPQKLRADPGTENVVVAAMHRALQDDAQSFICGSSTANQRIERWWGMLRQQRADYWIDHFKSLESNGLLMKENPLHKVCVQFIYLPLINKKLQEVMDLWNSHSIRPQKNGDVVSGIPDVLHNNPEIVGTISYMRRLEVQHIVNLRRLYDTGIALDDDFVTVAEELLDALQLPHPDMLTELSDAKHLFIIMKDAFDRLANN